MTVSEMNIAKNTLHEIANQAYGLAMGLQNAAPSQTGGPPKSVQYLLEISLYINKLSKVIEELIVIDSSKRK
ncbi:MAG: hypothetical protein ACD_60C00087G0020 [uncultured bacterium]|nr:MAG: hypothetical protein ACD_60C00087G0020 [uncultured bacterium]